MRFAVYWWLLSLSVSAWGHVAPVVSTYEIRFGKNVEIDDPRVLLQWSIGPKPPESFQRLNLYFVRPQYWTEGIPFGAELHWDYRFNVGEWQGRHLQTDPLSLDVSRHYFARNREHAESVLDAVFQFRTQSVLRDYKVERFEDLPLLIQEELLAIKDGTRAYVVLMKPGEFGSEAIELCVGVTYEEPNGLLSENRLKGRAVLANGDIYEGLSPNPPHVRNFRDNEILDQGLLDRPARIGENLGSLPFFDTGEVASRDYLSGARALLTTFVKNENSKLDLVPLIHQLLIASGVTRFGLTPTPHHEERFYVWQSDPLLESVLRLHLVEMREHARRNQRPILTTAEYALSNVMAPFLRINEIIVEAIGYPTRKNPLARLYRDWMGFETYAEIPFDPDFRNSPTELLKISADGFEFTTREKFARRPGDEIVRSAVLQPFFTEYPNRRGETDGRGFFVYQPAADRFMARGVLATLSVDPRFAHVVQQANDVNLDGHYCQDLIAGIPVGHSAPKSMLDIWGIKPTFEF